MKNQLFPILAGVAGLGLLSGYLAGRGTGDPEPESPTESTATTQSSRSIGTKRDRSGRDRSFVGNSKIRSSDTLETLLAAPEEGLYGRMALWLMDASPEDIATYWEKRKDKENQTHEIKDLVMIGWTRVDPRGAIAAVAGQGDEHFAWWAWACHDPDLALQTAIEESSDHLGNVAWGIGEFHPKWLRENFERIPESGRGRALQGLVKWGEVDDAMATLEFLREHNQTPPKDLLRNLARQDPMAAYDWFEENGSALNSYYGSRDDAMNMLIHEIADSHPEVLDQLIAEQPSGERKRAMENAAFSNLLKLDPEAAFRAALAVEAPRVGADRIAQVGLHLVRTDPDRGFEIARDLFERFPKALSTGTVIHYPNGQMSSGGSSQAASRRLLSELAAHDPARTLEMFSQKPGQAPSRIISESWARNDLDGFTDWVFGKNDQGTTDQFVPTISGQLQGLGRFEEAADTLMKMSPDLSLGDDRSSQLYGLAHQWHRNDPDRFQRWVDTAELSQKEVNIVQSIIKQGR